jgi:hypothetical protein
MTIRRHHIVPSPSQERVIHSTATIVVAVSVMGEGKTYSCIMSMIFHAYRNGKMLRACIIRDTHENLKRTVVVAFQSFFQESGLPHKWSNDFKKLWIYSAPPVEVDLLGIDDLASVANIQGGEWGLIWLEEPCPYIDSRTASAGLSEDVYNAALVRCARQVDVKARLQISSNHPDEEHWFYRRCMQAPDGMVDPRTPLITKEMIEFPRGENTHLKDEARQAVIAAYAHDPIAYARFVTGEAAMRYPGKAVTGRIFNSGIHVSPIPLEPVAGLTGFVGWDSWGNPAAVLGQQWPDGRLWILDELVDGEDVRDLLHNALNPLVQSPRWKEKCYAWRQIGDRSMKQPDQSRMAECAADAVEQEFDPGMSATIPFEPGPQTWEHSRLGLMHALQWMVRGQPAILIDPQRCKRLIGALKGRWHYPTNKAGVVTQRHPFKDESSHIADAFTNAVCIVAPWSAQMQSEYTKRRTRPPQSPRRRSLAASYATHVVGGF